MVKKLLLAFLLTSFSVLAQRTPFYVNGVAVENANLTNTPAITHTVVGTNILQSGGALFSSDSVRASDSVIVGTAGTKGALSLADLDGSHFYSLTPFDVTTPNINEIMPPAPFNGLLKWVVADSTNAYRTNAVAGQDFQAATSIAPAFTTLTDGATITGTCSATNVVQNWIVTLGGTRALAISGGADGMTGTLIVVQDGTGGWGLTLPATSKVVNGGAGAVTITSTANATTILTWIRQGSTYYWTYGLNFN